MQKLYDNAKKTQDEQKEFEIHIKKSHKLSVCLCNIAQLVTEFGPIKSINSLKEIESRQVLSAEEIKEKVFRNVDSSPLPIMRMLKDDLKVDDL